MEDKLLDVQIWKAADVMFWQSKWWLIFHASQSEKVLKQIEWMHPKILWRGKDKSKPTEFNPYSKENYYNRIIIYTELHFDQELLVYEVKDIEFKIW